MLVKRFQHWKKLKDDLLECYVEAQQEIEESIDSIEGDGFSFEKSLLSLHSIASLSVLELLIKRGQDG